MKCPKCKKGTGVVHCNSKTCPWRYCDECGEVISRSGRSFKKQ